MIVCIFVAKTTGRVLLTRRIDTRWGNAVYWQPFVRSGGGLGVKDSELIKQVHFDINLKASKDIHLDCAEMPCCWDFSTAYFIWVENEFEPYGKDSEFMWAGLYEFPEALNHGLKKLIRSNEFLIQILNPTS
jgi:hypothetical protein